ncbi:MAG: ABC-2 family transporter protein [Clostridiales bacterium]|nr:ABC-2 family transporter protein [Clostridiales bacterium]
MQYKFNFYMGILVDLIFFFNKIIYALIIYQTGSMINGISPDEVLLYIGTYSIVQGLYTTFFLVNLKVMLPQYIRTGNLDLYMVKPMSLQFFISCQAVEISTMIPDLLGGIIVVIIASKRLGIDSNIISIAGYISMLGIGLMLSYAIMFSIQLLSFFFVKLDAVGNIAQDIFSLNNLPSKLYNKSIRFVGTFRFPIFLVTNVAPTWLLHKVQTGQCIWFIVISVFAILLSRRLWKRVITRYTSASC